jgi:hypothetical protein
MLFKCIFKYNLRLLRGSFYFQKLSSVCGYVTNVCAIFMAIHGLNLLATPPPRTPRTPPPPRAR